MTPLHIAENNICTPLRESSSWKVNSHDPLPELTLDKSGILHCEDIPYHYTGTVTLFSEGTAVYSVFFVSGEVSSVRGNAGLTIWCKEATTRREVTKSDVVAARIFRCVSGMRHAGDFLIKKDGKELAFWQTSPAIYRPAALDVSDPATIALMIVQVREVYQSRGVENAHGWIPMLGRDGTWRSLLLPEMEVTGPSFNTEAEVVIHEMSELHKLAASNRV